MIVAGLLGGLACDADRGQPVPIRLLGQAAPGKGTPMTLHVALRDGFRDATVTMTVNGKNVYRKSGVTTDLTISFADSVDVPVEGPTVSLEVAVEGGARRREEVQVAETPFVAVQILDGKMAFLKSKEQMPML